jgi:hypothetical protein
MQIATCVFDLANDSEDEMLLVLEPEGSKFCLPSGRVVEVHLFGGIRPIEIKYALDEKRRVLVSFWPADGDFEIFFEGKSLWDQL